MMNYILDKLKPFLRLSRVHFASSLHRATEVQREILPQRIFWKRGPNPPSDARKSAHISEIFASFNRLEPIQQGELR